MSEFGGLIPVRWKIPQWAPSFVQFVLINWLEIQVPLPVMSAAEEERLDDLTGWRNREVYNYIQSFDWTARMFQ